MKFELEDSLRGASDEELLQELARCARSLGKNTVTIAEFEKSGRCHPSTIQRRFGSWFKALEAAGLEPSRSKIGITDDELFENIKNIWIELGRQPRYSEIVAPHSRYSAGTYEKRFGSWRKALQLFIDWVNSDDSSHEPVEAETESGEYRQQPRPSKKRRTRREISDRQRFRVLVRDGFRCMSCGASPLITPGVQLHVDHITPWSKGGETVDENLQSKCQQCNLGKGNAFDA